MASIKDVARRLAEEVFSRRDMRTFDEIFAESYRHNMPVPDIPGTKGGFRRLVLATRHAALAKAKPGEEAKLEQALREVAAPTRAQPGCLSFTHVQALMSKMAGILAEPPDIVSYEVVDEA